ncbi:MAG: hypothetical protein IFK94_01645 [Acidobacteria bacterium]|uniref:Uncharacterized protein n=1 Tax=Candidatus Polarisedimenticola svalbardensis TaxID=2886004 RepID=A0A8J6XTX9_9BACT|nr:hypothetical protein [Candidatus Polarisedimenticola svalbardensis]
MGHRFPLAAMALILPLVWFGFAGVAGADTVVKQDGTELEGELLSVNDAWVVLRTGGNNIRLAREAVAAIRFGGEAPAPPLKVELRNIRSSDAIDVLLEEKVVIRDARVGGVWVDLTPELKSGNNRLEFRIRNEHAGWGYHLQLRVNGEVETIGCGEPPGFKDPCRCCGKLGNEKGLIDDLPALWIYVDRTEGTAELMR